MSRSLVVGKRKVAGIVPPHVTAVDRVPLQTVSLGRVRRGQEDGGEPPPVLDDAQEEAPIVPRGEVVGVAIRLALCSETLALGLKGKQS